MYRLLSIVAISLVILLPVLHIHAQERTWTGAADNQWTNAGNWTGGVVPGSVAGSSAKITSQSLANPAVLNAPLANSLTGLRLDGLLGQPAILNINQGAVIDLAAGSVLSLNESSGNSGGAAVINQFDGSVTSNHTIRLARDSGVAIYNLSGGTLNFNSNSGGGRRFEFRSDSPTAVGEFNVFRTGVYTGGTAPIEMRSFISKIAVADSGSFTHGGLISMESPLAGSNGLIQITGSKATFITNQLDAANSNGVATLSFIFDDGGITPIQTTTFNGPDANDALLVDVTAYCETGNFDLITFTNTDGNQYSVVTVQGGTGTETVKQGANAISVNIADSHCLVPGATMGNIDAEAIAQVRLSGLPLQSRIDGVALRSIDRVTRDFNQRLFRARSSQPRESFISESRKSGAYSKFLNFAFDQGISYSEALASEAPHSSAFVAAENDDTFEWASVEQPATAQVAPIIDDQLTSGGNVGSLSQSTVSAGKKWEVFVSTDAGFYDQDPSGVLAQSQDSDAYSGTFGFEYEVNDWLAIGGGWSYLHSSTDVGALGGFDLDGQAATIYVTAQQGAAWATLLYSHSWQDLSLSRNTLFGANTVQGASDIQTNHLSADFGYQIEAGDNVVHGPILGIDYSQGKTDAYTESGDARFNISYADQFYETLNTRLGWQVSWTKETSWGNITPQVRAGWERQHLDDPRTAGGALQNSPFVGGGVFNARQFIFDPSQDSMFVGLGLGIETASGIGVVVDYQGNILQNSSSQHYISAGLEIPF